MPSSTNSLDTKTQFYIIKICLFLFLRFNQIIAENGETESINFVYEMNLQKVYYLDNSKTSVTLNVEGLMYLKVTRNNSYIASFEKMNASVSTKSGETIDIGSSPQFQKIREALQKPSRVTISKRRKLFSKMEVDENEPIAATNFKLFIFGTMEVDLSVLGSVVGTETEENLFWGKHCKSYYFRQKRQNDTYEIQVALDQRGCSISFASRKEESDDKFLTSTICKRINPGYYPRTGYANATVYMNEDTYFYPIIINYSYDDTFIQDDFHVNTTTHVNMISTNTDESINKFEVKNAKSVNQPIYRNLNRQLIKSTNTDDLHKVYKLVACNRILNTDASAIETAIEVKKLSREHSDAYWDLLFS